MKTMKKLLALLLALTMVFALATTAFAAAGDPPTTGNFGDEKGTIKVMNPVPGITYKAYRMLDLVTFSAETPDEGTDGPSESKSGHYAYKLNETWETFFTGTGKGAAYVIIDDQGYVTWNADANKTEFAALAKEFAKYLDEADAWQTVPEDHAANTPIYLTTDGKAYDQTATVDNREVDLGWYMVDTSLGSLVSMGTTDLEAEIWEKQDLVTGDKKAEDQDNTTKSWADGCTADVGEYIQFRVNIDCKNGASGYCVHDTMDAGLKLVVDTDHPIKVTITDADDEADPKTETVIDTDNYETFYGENEREHKTFNGSATAVTHDLDVQIKDSYLADVKDGDTIYVYYWAIVTEDAIIEDGTNTLDNHMTISYGHDNYTTEESTTTSTFAFKVVKTNEEGKALADAEFVLYAEDGYDFDTDIFTPGKVINMLEGEAPEVDGTTLEGDYYVACILADNEHTAAEHTADDHIENATIITTETGKGKFAIQGLDQGTYWLHETKAPTGYNEMQYPVKVIIDKDGEVSFFTAQKQANGKYAYTATKDTVAVNGTVTVVNKSGKEMPATGGMGTTIFYVVGSVMMIGAAVILVAKKRTSI